MPYLEFAWNSYFTPHSSLGTALGEVGRQRMGEEEAGKLSRNQIPQSFIILVRSVGCYPEAKRSREEV